MSGRAALAGFVAAFLGMGGALLGGNGRLSVPAVVQPIAFNHDKHVRELELDCTTCHASYEKEAFSGLPDAEVCAGCHAEPQGRSAEEARLVKRLQDGPPLVWQPLFRQPAHVFYSHRRHVVAGRLECRTCHGAIAQSKTPPPRVERLRMADCLDCHRRSGAGTACTTCHR